jgi:hypothetical protein
MRKKRVLFAALAAAALLVAPVAGTDAKQDGDGDAKESKKCEKLRHVGFKVNGTLVAGSDLTTIDVAVIRANRHARDWLAENAPTSVLGDDLVDLDDFVVDDGGVDEKVKFVGVTDNILDGTIDFEDAVNDRVKLKAKLEQLKHDCEDAVPEDDAVPEVGADDTQLEVSAHPGLDVTKVKVKATETD